MVGKSLTVNDCAQIELKETTRPCYMSFMHTMRFRGGRRDASLVCNLTSNDKIMPGVMQPAFNERGIHRSLVFAFPRKTRATAKRYHRLKQEFDTVKCVNARHTTFTAKASTRVEATVGCDCSSNRAMRRELWMTPFDRAFRTWSHFAAIFQVLRKLSGLLQASEHVNFTS